MTAAITIGAGKDRPQGRRVALSDGMTPTAAMNSALEALPDNVESWWSPHMFKAGVTRDKDGKPTERPCDYRHGDLWEGSTAVVIDADFFDRAGDHSPLTEAARSAILAEIPEAEIPAAIAHLTPRGARLIFPLDVPTSDPDGWKRAAQGACEITRRSLPRVEDGHFEVDVPASTDRARFYYGPRAVVDGVKRDSTIHLIRDRTWNLEELAHHAAPAPEGPKPLPIIEGRIVQGDRHGSLTSLAATLSSRGIRGEALSAVLQAANVELCSPPKDATEIARIADYFTKKDGEKQAQAEPPDVERFSKRPLLVLPLGELLSRSSPDIEWQIRDILPVEGVGILAGPPGCGKTWMLADLAIELSRGGFWMGHFPTRRGTVLCIDEESPSSLLPVRYRKLLLAKGLSAESVDVHFCIGQSFSFSRPSDVLRLREVLSRLKPSLVIVDSLIRVHSAEENSASEMSEVFAVVKALAREFHCAFLFADHMRKGKPGESSLDQMVRGSGDKAAFVDSLLVIKKTEMGAVVEHPKSRFAQELPGFVISLEDPQPGMTSVKYVGEANALKQERQRQLAEPAIEDALESGDWVPRGEIVDRGVKAGASKKAIDEILKERLTQGQLERDDRRPEGGKGNKLAFYRRRAGCEVIPFPSAPKRGEGSETGSGKDQRGDDPTPDDPVPGSQATSTGETGTRSEETPGPGHPNPEDPVPGSLSTNTGETGTGSGEDLAPDPTLPPDPVPGSPSISIRELGTGSQEES